MAIVAVLTGDLVQSRSVSKTADWMNDLKKVLSTYGASPKAWQIYRGDSFQLELRKPEESLLAALRIKATMRRIKGLDIRIAIGIGTKDYASNAVTESNGEAFVHSGSGFEALRKLKRRLLVSSPWTDFDREINLMILLASIVMDRWSVNSAEFMLLSVDHRDLSQQALGEKIGKKQSSVSEAQARASVSELLQLEQYYRDRVTELIQQT